MQARLLNKFAKKKTLILVLMNIWKWNTLRTVWSILRLTAEEEKCMHVFFFLHTKETQGIYPCSENEWSTFHMTFFEMKALK